MQVDSLPTELSGKPKGGIGATHTHTHTQNYQSTKESVDTGKGKLRPNLVKKK